MRVGNDSQMFAEKSRLATITIRLRGMLQPIFFIFPNTQEFELSDTFATLLNFERHVQLIHNVSKFSHCVIRYNAMNDDSNKINL